jgi:hypothetical protein
MEQKFKLQNGVTLEVKIIQNETECVTVSQRFVDVDNKFLSKTCTVTCGSGSSAQSYSWTCNDNQDCSGDCSDPNNPKGSCV